MLKFIDSKVRKAYNDFVETVDEVGCLCSLKGFTYKGTSLPDYRQPLVQQYYMMRYFPAYLAEYRMIYEQLLEFEFFDDPLNILSVGCGCGIDLWGLDFATEDNREVMLTTYTGLDIVDWQYRDDLDRDNVWYLQEDVTGLTELDEPGYNLIIFPKSIGEFDKTVFAHLQQVFRDTSFSRDKLCLICSLREARRSFDVERFASLASIMQETHGYTCLDDAKVYYSPHEKAGIRNIYSDFVYPNDLYGTVGNVLSLCPTFVENGEQCQSDCEILKRKPILNADKMSWQVLRFERN